MKYICYNGDFFLKDDFRISFKNRALNYGDGLFETLRASASDIFFFENHLKRLINGMKILKMKIPKNFENENLKNQIKHLILKNKLFSGVRIKILVIRKDGGLYTPINNEINYYIFIEKLPKKNYYLNKIGLRIGIFDEIFKEKTFYSNFKTINSMPFILAGIFKKENNLDDVILIDGKKQMVETISSNIFLIKDDFLFTPSLENGCVDGIMRKFVIKISKEMGLKISETKSLKKVHLIRADEVFLTNALQGIKWVAAYKDKRYFNKTAKKIMQKLIIMRNE
ncbi:MAG: hypothetical protein B6I24_01845 [Bacteroidetes bacterium 4572_128]|nr:MAG: hypothetical protein B6I24_01845 [Bacteroidetes bacterium 4572_128]